MAHQPLIEITDNAFKVTLPVITKIESEKVEEIVFNSSERKVIEMIDRLGQVKRMDVQNELKISQPMAVKLLKSLLEKEAIVRIGAGKNVIYEKCVQQY